MAESVNEAIERDAANKPTEKDAANKPTEQESANEPSGPLIGQVLGERYRVEKRLGAGGMGVVYRAQHMVLGTQLAVKVLLKPQAKEDQQRFLQEAKLASIVKHPNTVQIIDFGVLPSGQSYLVMELMAGRTLADDIKNGPMETLRVCQIGAQIARGLQAVHDQGIVHRDMKPDNVFLLNQDGSPDFVKIVDFGIAKSLQAEESPQAPVEQPVAETAEVEKREVVKTQDGLILGTPSYMSPEQCAGQPIDGRCDQYSVGCMLYKMLTGQFLFDHRSARKFMLAHQFQQPVPPRQRVPERNIPEALEAVVMRMVQKEPAARFPSMREVAEALTQASDLMLIERGDKRVLPAGLATLLGSRITGSHLWVRGRRIPVLAAAVALCGVLALAIGSALYLGYGLYQARHAEKPTLEPGELQATKAQALAVLKQAAQLGQEQALRLDAIATLGETKDAELRPQLQALLSDPDEAIQAEAAAALGRLGDGAALPALRAVATGEKGALLRLAAARAMLDLGDGSGEALLSAALGSGTPAERLHAASMLCDRHNAEAEKLLLKVVDEGLLKAESATLGALGCLLKSASAEEARARLRSRLKAAPSAEQQIEIAQVLARAGDAEGRRVLGELSSQPGLTQLPAARALAAPDVPAVAELFRIVLKDRQAQDAARLLASEGLGQSGRLLDIRLVGRFLKAGAELKTAAAVAVLRLAATDPTALGTESLRWARRSLGASDWQLRESAAMVLGDSAAAEAVPLLASMLTDKDARVRRGSARALGRRTEEPALLALKEALRDPDSDVRMEALRSIGRVGQALAKRGVRDVLGRLSGWFTEIWNSGSPREQILARTVLLRLGDRSQTEALRTWQSIEDPTLRRFLITESPTDARFALALLNDADPGVRFAAAQELAEAGDPRGVDILKEMLAQGGPNSIAAYGLLLKLGQKVAEPAAVQTTLAPDHPLPERMAAIEAMARLPVPLAVPLLLKAARDPEPLVRRLSAEVAAELPALPGTEGAPGFLVLRLLLSDPDPAVKNRAAALLLRAGVETASSSPAEKVAAAPEKSVPVPPPAPEKDVPVPLPAPEKDIPVPPPAPEKELEKKEETAEPEAEAAPGNGLLLLLAPEGTLYSIDDGKWQTASEKGKPMSLAQGEHRVTTMGGEYKVLVEADKKAHLTLIASPIDEAVQFGSRAYQQKDYAKAIKLYDRASALCSRDREHKKACLTLDLGLALDRGRSYEALERYSEAMTEYQKAVDGARGKTRAQAAEAMSRLSPQLGRVILRSVVKGKCQERVQWLPPGKKQKIKVGNKSKPVNVAAGNTIEVGECP